MTSGLASRITEAVKAAMRAHDSTRLSTLRLLQAAIKQKAVDERIQPDDAAILTIIEKQAKQRRESIAAYESAGRPEHVAQEQAELEILKEFLPQAASDEEVAAAGREKMGDHDPRAQAIAVGLHRGAGLRMTRKAIQRAPVTA